LPGLKKPATGKATKEKGKKKISTPRRYWFEAKGKKGGGKAPVKRRSK